MDTCFLFSKKLDDSGCFCLKMSPSGDLQSPLIYRDFAQIRELQEDANTIIVESGINATLLPVELPWLPERQARAAIPYALEDQLSESVDELHFAFDKQHYQKNQYFIVIIKKQSLQDLMQKMEQHGIEFSQITLDWFALAPHQLCISESTLLVNEDDFKGALSGELALIYMGKTDAKKPLLFEDSRIVDKAAPDRDSLHSYVWIATQLLKTKPMNLCQGEMQRRKDNNWIKKGYQIAGITCGLWLISLLLVNGLILNALNKKTAVIDEQIATIYHQFFPDAKQVISPKFRISQVLSTNQDESQARFWFLLNEFSKAININTTSVQEIHYQNKTLIITLISSDFSNLNQLEEKLKKAPLKMSQTEASSHEQKIIATLELK